MKVRELLGSAEPEPAFLDEVLVTVDGLAVEVLNEGRKWVSGRFHNNLGIDQPTHLAGAGQQHAHVLGRKGDELGVVNFDGSASHGSRFRLHKDDADELRKRGFTIRPDNLVEWVRLRTPRVQFLLG